MDMPVLKQIIAVSAALIGLLCLAILLIKK
jgi:hypothetical protein